MKVLLKGLSSPIGPAMSIDRTFLLFSEAKAKRITKYWLAGLKANRAEPLLALPGTPVKIKRASTFGDFWVAVDITSHQPRFTIPNAFKFNSFGITLLQKDLRGQYNNVTVSSIQEYNRRFLYIGSREVTFVGIYKSNL